MTHPALADFAALAEMAMKARVSKGPRNQDKFLRHLWAQEDTLKAKGFNPMSPKWRADVADFYKSGCKQAVFRKGRQVGASKIVAPRIAVCEALHGGHRIPPGERASIVLISVKRGEAQKRIGNITAVLDALDVAYTQAGDTISLKDRAIDFIVLTASLRTSVGDTAIMIWCDEVSRWRDTDTGANPAKQILSTVRPMIVTMPDARMWLVSSPLGKTDAHFEAFEAGDSDFQRCYFGETWVYNPTITEEQTRLLEPDVRRWAREYAAIPQEGELSAFDADAIARAFLPRPECDEKGVPVFILDPSSGRKDGYAWGKAYWCFPEGARSYLRMEFVDGFEGKFFQQLSSDQVVEHIAKQAAKHGVIDVHSDQREEFTLKSAFANHDLCFRSHDWTASSKPDAVERLRRLMADSRLQLAQHAKLKSELLSFEEKITPSGSFTFGARGSGHDDYVALLITAMMAIGRDGEFFDEADRKKKTETDPIKAAAAAWQQRVEDRIAEEAESDGDEFDPYKQNGWMLR